MMSLQAIQQVSQQMASQAAEMDQKPLYIDKFDIELAKRGNYAHLKIPALGDWLPAGFVRAEIDSDLRGVYSGDNSGYGAFFVDKSGCGSAGEPALTLQEFFEAIGPGYYAVVEEGQFQVKVGKFQRAGDC